MTVSVCCPLCARSIDGHATQLTCRGVCGDVQYHECCLARYKRSLLVPKDRKVGYKCPMEGCRQHIVKTSRAVTIADEGAPPAPQRGRKAPPKLCKKWLPRLQCVSVSREHAVEDAKPTFAAEQMAQARWEERQAQRLSKLKQKAEDDSSSSRRFITSLDEYNALLLRMGVTPSVGVEPQAPLVLPESGPDELGELLREIWTLCCGQDV